MPRSIAVPGSALISGSNELVQHFWITFTFTDQFKQRPPTGLAACPVIQVAGVAVSSLALSLAAHADVTIKLGADSGALVFEPSTVTVSAGEAITFKNNAGMILHGRCPSFSAAT
jgi:plastocyanin